MIPCSGYAVHHSNDQFQPFSFERRAPKPKDVLIEIQYCGICHSDIHQARNEWNKSLYPMVPGHEIVGRVKEIGTEVGKFQVGDTVGVGCLVDACRQCGSCQEGLEQYCEKGLVATYNSHEKDSKTLTFGGYSDCIVVDEDFVLKISHQKDLAGVAPLLCAGVTTYSPLKYWQAGPGKKVGVIGLGGLGHMAVQLAHSMGAEVTLLTSSTNKAADAKRLGATHVILSKDSAQMAGCAESLDIIINTVSARIDLDQYINCLKRDGVMVLLGVSGSATELKPRSLISKRRKLAGSLIGGLPETQEMLDYCAKHQITSQVEVIPIQKIDEAYERILRADVKYRFVIDLESLKK